MIILPSHYFPSNGVLILMTKKESFPSNNVFQGKGLKVFYQTNIYTKFKKQVNVIWEMGSVEKSEYKTLPQISSGVKNIFPFNLFIWLRWVFIAACGLSLVAASGGYSSFRCSGFSLWWLLLLQSTGSRRTGFSSCGSWAPERRLSICGTRAQLLRGMWHLPGPGLEPVSPALAGGFLTTEPLGKSPLNF